MSAELTHSNYACRGRRVQHILFAMGVEFAKTKHKSFWLANEGRLEYVYHDFKVRAKELKVLLHPDRALTHGDRRPFQVFNADCKRVQDAFRRHGVEPEDPVIQEIKRLDLKERRKAAAIQFNLNPDQRQRNYASRRRWLARQKLKFALMPKHLQDARRKVNNDRRNKWNAAHREQVNLANRRAYARRKAQELQLKLAA